MIKTFNVGIKSLIVADNKVLLCKKQDQDGLLFWDIPGGRVDGSETIHETLIRELKEEVSSLSNFSIDKLIHAHRLEKDLKDGNGLMLLFYRIIAAPFNVVLSDEHEGYQWFSAEELERIENTSSVRINPGYLHAALSALKK